MQNAARRADDRAGAARLRQDVDGRLQRAVGDGDVRVADDPAVHVERQRRVERLDLQAVLARVRAQRQDRVAGLVRGRDRHACCPTRRWTGRALHRTAAELAAAPVAAGDQVRQRQHVVARAGTEALGVGAAAQVVVVFVVLEHVERRLSGALGGRCLGGLCPQGDGRPHVGVGVGEQGGDHECHDGDDDEGDDQDAAGVVVQGAAPAPDAASRLPPLSGQGDLVGGVAAAVRIPDGELERDGLGQGRTGAARRLEQGRRRRRERRGRGRWSGSATTAPDPSHSMPVQLAALDDVGRPASACGCSPPRPRSRPRPSGRRRSAFPQGRRHSCRRSPARSSRSTGSRSGSAVLV